MSPRGSSTAPRVAQIHEAALALFAQRGYHETTMDNIVERTGLSKGTLYWYFESKQDLLISLFRQVMQELMGAWREAIDTGGETAEEKLHASLAFFRSRAEQMTTIFGILIEAWSLSRRDDVMVEAILEAWGEAAEAMDRLLESGTASGEFQVQEPTQTAFVILSLIAGLMLRMGSGIWVYRWDEILDTVEPLLLNGLREEAPCEQG